MYVYAKYRYMYVCISCMVYMLYVYARRVSAAVK